MQITIWVEQDNDKSTVSWNAGFGLVNRVGKKPGAHWDDTTKPNMKVSGSITHFHLGEEGRLWMQIVQNNNGRIVCTGENTGDRKSGGTVRIELDRASVGVDLHAGAGQRVVVDEA